MLPLTHSLTHSLTHTLSFLLLSRALTCSLTHSLTHLLPSWLEIDDLMSVYVFHECCTFRLRTTLDLLYPWQTIMSEMCKVSE
jgi:hypothetical protein